VIEKTLIYSERREYSTRGSELAKALINWGVDMVTFTNLREIPQNVTDYHAIIITNCFSGNIQETAKFVRKLRECFLGPIIAYQSTHTEHVLLPLLEAGCNFAYEKLDDLMRNIARTIEEEKPMAEKIIITREKTNTAVGTAMLSETGELTDLQIDEKKTIRRN
jgi:hypothetical protein